MTSAACNSFVFRYFIILKKDLIDIFCRSSCLDHLVPEPRNPASCNLMIIREDLIQIQFTDLYVGTLPHTPFLSFTPPMLLSVGQRCGVKIGVLV